MMTLKKTPQPLRCLARRPLLAVQALGRLPASNPTRLTALVAVVSAAVLLSACATPGAAPLPLAARDAASLGLAPAAALPAPAQWWRSLGDPALDALVVQALREQPSLAAAQARARRAQALAGLSEAAHGPQVQLSAELLRERYSEHGLLPAPIAGNVWTTGSLSVGASWSPDFFGQYAAELASAVGQARAAQADAAAAASALATQVARGYVALARLGAQREVVERMLAQRTEMQALTRERVTAGLDTRVEQTQADGALPDLRAQIEALDEQQTLTRRQLAVLAGQAPEAQAALSPRLSALALAEAPAALGADLLGRRADVVAARWRVEAAGQDVDSARAQFYPNINLAGFVGLNALGLNHLMEGGSRQLGVQPALHLPLFDGGRLRAQLGSRQAERDVAVAQYNAVVLDAVREAGDAIASEQSIARQRQQQARAQAAAESAYGLALRRYRAGLGNYLIVLATETQVLAQRRLAIDLHARQLDTRASLMKALGGGWTDATATPDTLAQR